MKQTAVEWLVNQMLKRGYFEKDKPLTFTNLDHLMFEAKEMEKQQIMDAAERWKGTDFAEKYYAETYGSKGSDDHIVDTNEMVSSQTEISDEDIEDVAWEKFITDSGRFGFISGAQWYREQLKNKQ